MQHHTTPHGPDNGAAHTGRRRVLLILAAIGATVVLGSGAGLWWLAGRLGLMHGPVTAALGFGENWSPRAIADTEAQGETLIREIERYRAAHDGGLPPSLGALTPEYLAEIPVPSVGGRRWRVGVLRDHPEHFYLTVASRWEDRGDYFGIAWLSYNSLDRRWTTFKEESPLLD